MIDVEYVRYSVMLHVMSCNVRCEMWCCDVERWCGTCAIWWRAVKMRNVVVEYGAMRNGLTGFDVECVPRCGSVARFDVKCGPM